jgi:hypothetical protein
MSRQAANERTERISNPQQHNELVLGVICTNTSPYSPYMDSRDGDCGMRGLVEGNVAPSYPV